MHRRCILCTLCYRFPQLSESFILDQITGMLDLGQEVGIYADVGRTDDPIHPQVEAYRLLERTRYLPGASRSRLGSTRQAARALLGRPGLVGWIMAGRKKPLKEVIRSLAKVHGFVWPRAPKYDIVHCQFGCVAKKYWFSKSLWNAKLVVSFRGHDFSSLPRIYGPGLYKELFQEVDAVTVVCKYAVAKLVELGCPPEKLVIHHSGTDVEEFRLPRENPRSERGGSRVDGGPTGGGEGAGIRVASGGGLGSPAPGERSGTASSAVGRCGARSKTFRLLSRFRTELTFWEHKLDPK